MNKRQWIYLLLAILGAILPWYYNWQFMQQSESPTFDLMAFIAGGMANPAAASLSTDLFIAAAAGFTWIVLESKRVGMKHVWVYFLIGVWGAFACAFPLFLFMRERQLIRLTAKQADTAEQSGTAEQSS